jgi:hypothetical protein
MFYFIIIVEFLIVSVSEFQNVFILFFPSKRVLFGQIPSTIEGGFLLISVFWRYLFHAYMAPFLLPLVNIES